MIISAQNTPYSVWTPLEPAGEFAVLPRPLAEFRRWERKEGEEREGNEGSFLFYFGAIFAMR